MKVNLSSLTKPSFKKFTLLVAIFIVFIGGGMALASRHGTADSSMPVTHGLGYQLQATVASKITKITPSTFNCNSARPTAACRCQNSDSSFCQCLKSGEGTCTFCLPNDSDFCVTCTVNGSMIACKINDGDNDNDDNGGVVTPHSTAAPTAGMGTSSDGTTSSGSYGPSWESGPTNSNDGGNTTGGGANNTPSNNPGCTQNTGPHPMGIACRAPSNSGGSPSSGGVHTPY